MSIPGNDEGLAATIYYCEDIPRARLDKVDPSKTYMPLQPREVRLRDARQVRDTLDLDRQGFLLADHASAVRDLRDMDSIRDRYLDEVGGIIESVSGADLVMPYADYINRRMSLDGRPGVDVDREPALWAHMDFTDTFIEGFMLDFLRQNGHDGANVARMAVYQTWAPFSDPPEDFPLALIDSTTVKAGDYVVMDNWSAYQGGYSLETRLGKYDPDHRWYYVPDMRTDEMLIFKGNDTKFRDDQCVLHTAFDNRSNHANTVPRESLETRVFAYWFGDC